MALREFWFLLDGSHLEKRRGVCRGKQSKLAKVKSKSILDMLRKIKENHIDSIADVYEQKTASLDMKKPTKNVNKEIKQFDIANYIALQRQPSDFEKCTFMCNIWKPNADFVFPKTLRGAKKFSCNQEWFKKYEWLVYSPKLDKAFCKYCSFFPSNSGIDPKFATDGENYWKSCTFKLAKHMTKDSHGLAKTKHIGFKFTTKAPKKGQ